MCQPECHVQAVFPIEGEPAHSIHLLTPEEHTGLLQDLYEKCVDYVLLVDGHEVSPEAAKETFQETPPGRPLSDKFIYGVFNQDKALVGVLEGMRHYPEEAIWWIGLLLIIPEARGSGLGGRLVRSFAKVVRSQQGAAIMLGVVEENQAAFRFWQGLGFEVVRQTEPRLFDQKMHRVSVMRLSLEKASDQRG